MGVKIQFQNATLPANHLRMISTHTWFVFVNSPCKSSISDVWNCVCFKLYQTLHFTIIAGGEPLIWGTTRKILSLLYSKTAWRRIWRPKFLVHAHIMLQYVPLSHTRSSPFDITLGVNVRHASCIAWLYIMERFRVVQCTLYLKIDLCMGNRCS